MGCFHSKVAKGTVKVEKELSPLTQHITDVPVSTHVQLVGDIVDNCSETDNRTSINEPVVHKELSQDQISEYVQLALNTYLPDYEFLYTTSSVQANIPSNSNASMQVARDRSISLNPDLTGTSLAYGLRPTMYVLHHGRKPPNSVIFVYQWDAQGQTYLTSPYSIPTKINGTTVPCADPRGITCPLLESDPVPGITYELKQLYSVDTDTRDNSLAGPDFEWNFSGAYPIAFRVISSTTRLYWEDVDGNSGEVQFTNNNVVALLLTLVRIR